MMAEVMEVLVPFLSFATTYIPSNVNNMFALMLDLHFKCLDLVKYFMRWAKVMEMVVEYETKSLMSLVVVAFHLQNLGSVDPIDALVVADEDSIFGSVTSTKETLCGLLKNELF
jgi:hypothetical protein